jgi:hypothetical protein
LRQIFLCRNAWLSFWTANVLLLRWGIVWNVAKMLLCRNGWGYREYGCPSCGTSRRVHFSCKSRFCSSCGKVAVDRWVQTTLSDVLDVPYQHLVFTVPEELRDWIQCNRTEALNALFGAASSTLLDWTSQRGYRPGIIAVQHTFGADLKFNPHLHLIITCGGLSPTETWIANCFLPQKAIRPMYRYAFLKALSALFKAGRLHPPPAQRSIRDHKTFESYLTQFHRKEWYVHFGRSLEDPTASVRYIGRYCKRPVLAESKIEAFDGKTVTFGFKDRATGEQTSLALPTAEFIARIIQHIPEPHFRVVRHYGLFSNRTRSANLAATRQALKQRPKLKPAPLLWRDLFQRTFHKDPLACPICRRTMAFVAVTFTASADIRARVSAQHSNLKSRRHAHASTQKTSHPPKLAPSQPLPACASP